MRTAISLDGEWQLAHWIEGKRQVAVPAELLGADCAFIPTRVPGNVELCEVASRPLRLAKI